MMVLEVSLFCDLLQLQSDVGKQFWNAHLTQCSGY